MARKKKAAEPQEEAQAAQEAAPEGPQDYEVTAAVNLGHTVTGGARIPKGKRGALRMDPARYDRYDRAGYFA